MKSYAQQTIDVFHRLSEPAQISLLKFAKFLEADESNGYLPYDEAEMDEDIALYDAAKANDDGYRISVDELRKEYGI